MSIKTATRTNRIGRAFAIFGAAVAASAAVENHRKPDVRDLTTLGIDPEVFGRIR
jgi:hypothetical protein